MRGDNWDGTITDLSRHMKPVTDAMREHMRMKGLTGRQLCDKAGQSHTWLAELMCRMTNPRLGRLCRWAHLIGAQEFGLFLNVDGQYTTHTCYDIDEPLPWVINGNGRQIPDFRETLYDLVAALRVARKRRAASVDKFIAVQNLKTSHSVVAALESGERTRSPCIGHLATWAKSAGAEQFGVYVLADGTYTEADLLAPLEEE
jgi:transcriptional regulator with XRE-family HTH domain